jgi:competence protein ComGC
MKKMAGFSLLEIIVVAVILFILLAISIPVVRDMTSLARRSNCEQNLIRLVTANQAYSLDFEHLPAGTLTHGAEILTDELLIDQPSNRNTGSENMPLSIVSLPDGYHHNWVSAILPYCDRQTTFQMIDFKVSVYAPENATVRASDMPFLRCPTSADEQIPNTTSYAGMHSSVADPIAVNNDGLLTLNRHFRPDDVPDGMAYTILLGEKLSPPEFDLGWMSGTRSSLRNTGTKINSEVPIETYHDPAFVGGLGSLHGSGALVGMGDGAVDFLSDSIDIDVLREMVKRNDRATLASQ